MPALVGPIRHAEVIIYGIIGASGSNSKNTVNVFQFRRTSVSVNPSKANLNTAFQAGIGAALLAALNLGWTHQRNTIRWLNDAEDAPTDFVVNQPGLVAGDRMSSIASVYLRMRTALRGRNYRGSKHFGPLSESDTTTAGSDVLNAAAIVRWQAVRLAMATQIVTAEGNNWNLEVVSRNLTQRS